MDREAWRATALGVAKSRTRLREPHAHAHKHTHTPHTESEQSAFLGSESLLETRAAEEGP